MLKRQGKEMQLEKDEIMYAIGQSLIIVGVSLFFPMVIIAAAASSI